MREKYLKVMSAPRAHQEAKGEPSGLGNQKAPQAHVQEKAP
ncbi:hypothetical protein HMPREF1862_00808 [Varibaculum cambriense]|uniref:Uncharacterized protein n=1 Tax=Varibaculum cambriense TaxID=184870 RepID=A0AB34WZY3_9ACTO|nr:hypothetical protein HMPREF1862_00808 [Varibaculum cambriense]